ncbi:MAG: signal recognition particle protein [Chloroflexi bacterium]|mgnify:FL=1|nr:signal recognition particle protein [Chloroflexota bacterium]|tara:strand:- start:7988 stop:9328 length:1341 start_codon:yes stop_codon:yes gene_type:complete
MFDNLSEKFTKIVQNLTSKGKISEQDIKTTLREVRLALLEADVDFTVAKKFISSIEDKAKKENVFSSLTPGQTIIKIVKDEMTSILGEASTGLNIGEDFPTKIMLIGLQGVGKTTTAAKLALHLRKLKNSVLMVGCDLQRPAAIEQIIQLGKELNIEVYNENNQNSSAILIAKEALKYAKEKRINYVIFDTAGRLAIDEELMNELMQINKEIDSDEVLLTLDAMTGQDAVNSGNEFNKYIPISGIILTKMDGDARGGAALSMKAVTGIPIKFVGTGEKPDEIEIFHPDRVASRILGMGDVETLIEKAQKEFDIDQVKNLENKIKKNQFDLNDMLQQFQSIKKMGSMTDLLGMVPGLGSLKGKINSNDISDDKMKKAESIIYSMTPYERSNPESINGSRRNRIANGSGTNITEVNQVLNQFKQMQKMIKQFSGPNGKRNIMQMFNKK